MTGPMLDAAAAEVSPEGVFPHESATQPRPRIRAGTVAGPLAPPTRLKRIVNGWMAAANAYRERQAAWLAQQRAGDRHMDSRRIYRGPIDDALERAMRLRQRRRLEKS